MEDIKKEKERKPFNVVLLGNIESERAALLHKFIKKRFAIKQLKEMKISDENGENNSNINEIMNNVEIHGETVRMKIWDNVSANKIFTSSNKSLKSAQGVILFYSVADRKSFNMLKLSLSKILDFDKYDIPMVMVGNDSDTPNREVTYEEAKSLADSYGLRFYETSISSGMGEIFEDIGEQVFYQEYGDNNNNNDDNNNNDNDKNNNLNKHINSLSTSKSTKNINKKINIYSNNDLYDNDFNKKLRNKKGSQISMFNLSRDKSCDKKNNSRNKNKNVDENNSDNFLDFSIHSYINTNNNNNNDNNRNNNKDKKKNLIIKSPDILINSSVFKNTSTVAFSYQGNTQSQKKREEEIKEKRLKREKEMKSWWKKRENENIEKQKIKKQKEKEELQKKIKEDKINQKEREKKVIEENNIKLKNNYEQKKKNYKDIEKEISQNKENKRMEKLLEKKNNKEKLYKLKEQKEKENNLSSRNRKIVTYNKSENNYNKNNLNKLRGRNKNKKNINKNEEEKENENDSLNCSIITQEEQEIIKKNCETKNLLIENYQKNSNIYRCLKCRLIPDIIFNEYNQEIESYCDDSYNDQSHHNITTYSIFQDLSLNHPIDSNNIICYYCNKAINELLEGQTLYYCSMCNIYFCTQDEEIHKNQKHKNFENLKEKYLEISKNKINNINNKNKNNSNASSQNKNNKALNKQKSTPLLLNKKNKVTNQNNKGNIKKINKDNKNNNDINSNNNNIILTDRSNISNRSNRSKEKKKNNNYNKIQIYLIDSYCDKHNEIFKSYCFDCHKNMCDICENNHINHNTIQFEEILLDNEELKEKKNGLNKAKEDLMKINDYFSALIEAIKCKFERLFNIKKKELEIKEKIINDYETIKYNYHCINNIRNIKFDNNKTYIDKSNSTDWFHRFNLIFKYLNSDLNTNNNDIFDILNNRNENKNINIISNNNYMNNINKLIILKNEDIAISTQNGNIVIFDKDNLKEKLNIKVFDNNKGINDFIEKDGGGLLACGYEYVKYFNLSLNNMSYNHEKEFNIYDENNNINSIIELNNNLLITTDNNSILKLWNKSNEIKRYKNIDCNYCYLDKDNNKEAYNILYKINYNSFIFYSFNNNNLSLFTINIYDKIELKTSLEDIKLIKGNNSIFKYPNDNYLLLSCYENDIINFDDQEKDENIYNNLNFNYKEYFSIILVDMNNFNIISIIKNNYPFIDMAYYAENLVIALDIKGRIHKVELDKYQQNLFSIDKIHFHNSYGINNTKIFSINLINNKKNLILQLSDKIINISNLD